MMPLRDPAARGICDYSRPPVRESLLMLIEISIVIMAMNWRERRKIMKNEKKNVTIKKRERRIHSGQLMLIASIASDCQKEN